VRLTAADRDLANWMTYGRTYSEQRFSPLTQITVDDVVKLKPAWHFDLDSDRGQEETPIIVDGVMYVGTAWSEVVALDARNGAHLWTYDPKVPKDWSLVSCCDAVNHGVAVWNGRVYVGTLDGRLVALDAQSGKPVWEVLTIAPGSKYTIPGAPRVVKGKVLIGNGGGDYGPRGYLSAYEAETGKLAWRFYTVPGDPSKPFESPALKKAAKTWDGKLGLGGSVWDSISYDPDLNLVYFGVGNAPEQSYKGERMDKLFTDSIVAVNADTGEYVWHYQENPDDVWDYDSTPQIILADVKIDGQMRKVLLHAPKSGFFYVLDRATGELLSAKPLFQRINWATGIDMKTGRPIENPAARNAPFANSSDPFVVIPGYLGGHSWQSMSYSPLTGLVYIEVMEWPNIFAAEDSAEKNLAQELGGDAHRVSLPAVIARVRSLYTNHIAAWDPVAQHEVWRVEQSSLWNGGTLVTAGNLVFEGASSGELAAYRADNGAKAWSTFVQTAIIGPPITYEAGGEQYVALAVGWGGSLGLKKGPIGLDAHVPSNRPRVLAFKLNGTDVLPTIPPPVKPALNPPPDTASAALVSEGHAEYTNYCSPCHGYWAISAGEVPDLRYSASLADPAMVQRIVHDGLLRSAGMPAFAQLRPKEINAIRAYIIHRANEQLAEDRQGKQH
jgi:PQQ-dependent dehydrogenase (methanol/ethanol family)